MDLHIALTIIGLQSVLFYFYRRDTAEAIRFAQVEGERRMLTSIRLAKAELNE